MSVVQKAGLAAWIETETGIPAGSWHLNMPTPSYTITVDDAAVPAEDRQTLLAYIKRGGPAHLSFVLDSG